MTALTTIVFLLCSFVFLVVVMNMALWPGVRKKEGEDVPAVSVLIPARNEERRLGSCLDSVSRQGPAVAEVLVYDDHSTDGTADLAGNTPPAMPHSNCCPALPCRRMVRQTVCMRSTGPERPLSEWFLFLDAEHGSERGRGREDG